MCWLTSPAGMVVCRGNFRRGIQESDEISLFLASAFSDWVDDTPPQSEGGTIFLNIEHVATRP